MELRGREYTFDYGDMVLRVRYLSDSRLAWTQVKGPDAGSHGEQDFLFARVRPGVYFLWWQEEDASVVSQVVDIGEGRVYTTWVSGAKDLMAFQGIIQSG